VLSERVSLMQPTNPKVRRADNASGNGDGLGSFLDMVLRGLCPSEERLIHLPAESRQGHPQMHPAA